MKEFRKLVSIWERYGEWYGSFFFWLAVYVVSRLTAVYCQVVFDICTKSSVQLFIYACLFQHKRRRAFMGHSYKRVIQSDQHGSWFDGIRCPSACWTDSLVSTHPPSTCAYDTQLCFESIFLDRHVKFPHLCSCPSNWFSPSFARSTFQRLPVYFYLPASTSTYLQHTVLCSIVDTL